MTIDPLIGQALSDLPEGLTCRSGSVFYSALPAFSGASPIYILGLNPGGDPLAQAQNTVRKHITDWREQVAPYSCYVDEEWEGKAPGTHGMQPRIRHMFDQLGLDLRLTPASNVVFVRSRGEADLAMEKAALLSQCWPVHQAVISALGVRAVLCLGNTAGNWVREALGAHQPIDHFCETYANRSWRSRADQAPDGRAVITVTHPGRADWTNPDGDPTRMVRRVLASGYVPR